VEIGSSEEEWNDSQAAEAIAKSLVASMKRDEVYETVFGIGGGHYAKDFTKLVIEEEVAVAHMAPKYALDELDEQMFRQAIERNVEKISKIIILKKETNSSQKKKVIAFAESFGIDYELI
jgi:D-aminoacyl-tRNA deacylase